MRQRPAILLIMGILNIVAGVFGLLCGACGLVANAGLSFMGGVQGPKGEKNPLKELLDHMTREVPGYMAVEIGKPSLVLILSIIVIVAGIGLIMVQGWARWASVFYALATIVLHLFYTIYELAFVQPAFQRFITKQQGPFAGQQNPGQQIGSTIGVVLGATVFIVYALALLVVMFLPPVSAAFSGNSRRSRLEEEEDYDDRRTSPRRSRGSDEDDEDQGRFYRRDRDE